MGLVTYAAIALVVLSVVGSGASAFFGSVANGIEKTTNFVESSPILNNLTQETKQFVTEQGSQLAKETLGMFVVQDVFANDDDDDWQRNYDSGWDHGCSDAQIYDSDDYYINQEGKGKKHHSDEFNLGYDDGFYSCGPYVIEEVPQPVSNSDSSAAQSQSQEQDNDQKVIIYNCPPDSTCKVEES